MCHTHTSLSHTLSRRYNSHTVYIIMYGHTHVPHPFATPTHHSTLRSVVYIATPTSHTHMPHPLTLSFLSVCPAVLMKMVYPLDPSTASHLTMMDVLLSCSLLTTGGGSVGVVTGLSVAGCCIKKYTQVNMPSIQCGLPATLTPESLTCGPSHHLTCSLDQHLISGVWGGGVWTKGSIPIIYCWGSLRYCVGGRGGGILRARGEGLRDGSCVPLVLAV